MSKTHLIGFIVMALAPVFAACAQATRPAPGLQGAPSKISSVTVYQAGALVSREVTTPEGVGIFELVVSPLPPSTEQSSLYSEGSDGVRVLTTRYRTWTMQENLAEEIRKLDAQLKEIAQENQSLQQKVQVGQQNLQFMSKMEDFTAGALKQLTEKGQLNAESVTKIGEFVMTTRQTKSEEIVALQQKLQANNEKTAFLTQDRAKLSAGSDRTIREAVVVVDKPNAGVAKVKLNYIVTAASWRPQYKLRADAAGKAEANLEYLAAIFQQSGEDWSDVELTLSTAQPLLNAAPPELAMLEVGIGAKSAPGGAANPILLNGGRLIFGDNRDNWNAADKLRQAGQQYLNNKQQTEANSTFNDAAVLMQTDEILNPQQLKLPQASGKPLVREGQSVTFHMERRTSIPWRDDEQIIEVARIAMKPDYFYKAVPVLTPHVYRLANLTNDSKYVILPGEATMYIGKDFVGRDALPLVAIGETFTAGFGVDPQLQVARTLVDKTKTVQGGNQVLRFDYRVSVSSYKSEPVKLQLWDRLPHSDTDAMNVTLMENKTELSKDPGYVRDEKPKNLLRWDMEIAPLTSGEKATTVTYQYKLEFAKDAAIGNFLSR